MSGYHLAMQLKGFGCPDLPFLLSVDSLTISGLTMSYILTLSSIEQTSLIILFANSHPLSDWRIVGESNIKNISITLCATSSTVLDFNGFSCTNFVKLADTL